MRCTKVLSDLRSTIFWDRPKRYPSTLGCIRYSLNLGWWQIHIYLLDSTLFRFESFAEKCRSPRLTILGEWELWYPSPLGRIPSTVWMFVMLYNFPRAEKVFNSKLLPWKFCQAARRTIFVRAWCYPSDWSLIPSTLTLWWLCRNLECVSLWCAFVYV